MLGTVIARGQWLTRSRQAWKLRIASLAGFLGFALLVLAFIGPPRWAAIAVVFAFLSFAANIILPLIVRCDVCGLQLDTSLAGRKLPRDQRMEWIESLKTCPVCDDDGLAQPESRDRWRRSGLTPEKPYWSPTRILLALLMTFLSIGGAIAVGGRLARTFLRDKVDVDSRSTVLANALSARAAGHDAGQDPKPPTSVSP